MTTRDFAQVIHGHVLEVLAGMEPETVDCVVTSPPYWGLRSYPGQQIVTWPDGSTGAFGLEKTVEAYLEHSVEILRAIRRVLKPWGVCWWNIADSYASGKGTCFNPGGGKGSFSTHGDRKDAGVYPLDRGNVSMLRMSGLKPLDLCLIPEKLAVALQIDGWWVRSIVVWAKDNPMPESVAGWRFERHRVKVKSKSGKYWASNSEHEPTQWIECPGCPKCSPNDGLILRKGSWRPTDSYEHILMLTKSESYFADGEGVREPSTGQNGAAANFARLTKDHVIPGQLFAQHRPDREATTDTGSRNLRNVWRFPTAQFKGAHFAVFPDELPRKCILASTSEKGNCSRCGRPRARVIERKAMVIRKSEGYAEASGNRTATAGTMLEPAESTTIGWRATCSCNAPSEPALVLDLFCGTGTTLAVAKSLGRRSIGIDISQEYCAMSYKRLEAIGWPML